MQYKIENKQLFLNKLVEALQETELLGDPAGNPLVELRYIRDANNNEIVRPVFRDSAEENSRYDIRVNCDSCAAMYGDIWRQFISRL